MNGETNSRMNLPMNGQMNGRMSGNLERRYRRVLRVLPGYYREQWEQDMVAAFLDSWLTGDPEADAYISRAAGPSWGEVASVIGWPAGCTWAARTLCAGTSPGARPLGAVLTVMLVHAVRGISALVFLAWAHRLFSSHTAPTASLLAAPPGGVWPVVWEAVDCAWIAVFVALVLGHKRTARVIAVLAIVPTPSRWCRSSSPMPGQSSSGHGPIGSCSNLLPPWPWPRFTGTPRRLRIGRGCWRCLPATF